MRSVLDQMRNSCHRVESWVLRDRNVDTSSELAACCHVRKQMQQQQHSDNAWWHHKLWQLWSVFVGTVSSAPTHNAASGVEYSVSFQRCQLMREVAEMELLLDMELELELESESEFWLCSLYAPLTCKSNFDSISQRFELGTVYTIRRPKVEPENQTEITKFVVWQKAQQAI